jgi:hypothetical protein
MSFEECERNRAVLSPWVMKFAVSSPYVMTPRLTKRGMPSLIAGGDIPGLDGKLAARRDQPTTVARPITPAPTVLFERSSTRMNEPV